MNEETSNVALAASALVVLLTSACYQGYQGDLSVATTGNDPNDAGGGSCHDRLDCQAGWFCVEQKCSERPDPDNGGNLGDDMVEEGEPQLPLECFNGAKAYASKTSADYCPISLLIMVDNHGGKPAVTEEQIAKEIDYVNEFFKKSFLSFEVIDIRYYDHDYVIPPYDKEKKIKYTELNDPDIVQARGEGHIVLAFIHSEFAQAVGRAHVGGDTKAPAAFVRAKAGPDTTVHELGHSMGLEHTFEPYRSPEGDEPPDLDLIPPLLGSNPYNTGDGIKDTPIDPGPDFCSVTDCEEFASCKGEFSSYKPYSYLAMSYYSESCRSPDTAFTDEQINRMRCTADTYLTKMWSCNNCTPEKYTKCSGKNLHYFDSCNKIGPVAQNCNDGNPCTTDSCGNGACQNTPVANGKVCGDGLICKSGSCLAEDAQQCDSGDCCASGVFRPPSFVCQPGAETEYGCPWGTGAGDDVGVRTRDRLCSGTSSVCDGAYGAWSTWATAGDCSTDEICVPGQTSCIASCQETGYWENAVASETDFDGIQSNQTINVSVTMEVAESGTGLRFRLCKGNGVFENNIKVSITDVADGAAYADVANLTAAGSACSQWAEMSNDTNYATGDQFGGKWNMVSPASSAAEWPTYDCGINGNPSGTCWNGTSVTMTRTCK